MGARVSERADLGSLGWGLRGMSEANSHLDARFVALAQGFGPEALRGSEGLHHHVRVVVLSRGEVVRNHLRHRVHWGLAMRHDSPARFGWGWG